MGVEWWAGEHAHQHRSGAVAAVAVAADYGPQPTGRPRVPQHGARIQHHLQPRHRHQASTHRQHSTCDTWLTLPLNLHLPTDPHLPLHPTPTLHPTYTNNVPRIPLHL